MKKRVLSLILCLALSLTMVSALAGCGKKNNEAGATGKADAFVIMTEQLDGLFNPFYFTSANDGTIVSMTQVSMLTSKYVNGENVVAFGDNEAVVTKDFAITENADNTTTYTFVLKNGIKFSDGHPLTMEDVLFNYYVYLDPVYTGSNTLYSTKILGLNEYRTQTVGSGSSSGDQQINSQASSRAQMRINELIEVFQIELDKSKTGDVSYDTMVAAINSRSLSSGYRAAISSKPDEVTNAQLLADYEDTLKRFKEELGSDYLAAQESFNDEPYKSHSQFQNEIFCFMFLEGYVETKYAKGADGKTDRSVIESMTPKYNTDVVNSKEAAIEYVYNDKISRELHYILSFWATAAELSTEYTAQAKEVILHEKIGDDGSLAVPNISGIQSLAHNGQAGTVVNVNGTDYTVASGHNADGTVTNANEYDVLQVTIEGVDPKAKWNFAITIAPQHYYGEGSSVGVDIANNQFGVEYSSFSFMSEIVQSQRNVRLPMGAGPYKVTDGNNSDAPVATEFYKNNIVYFKANNYFETMGSGINNANIQKVRYQIISSNNAISMLESGAVHYISPSLTNENFERLDKMEKAGGYKKMTTDQLGYGYIGINAAKVNDVNIRRAIMYAMNTHQALSYYRDGTAERIFWNMSTVSWAYPKDNNGDPLNDNSKGYPQIGNTWDEEGARNNIAACMQAAGVSAGDSALRLTFTVAGATNDHPTYAVFRDAAALLNSMGWEVKVVCDSQALTKISTGSLAVWAAAWSSALDPDMYQVYHKDSSATSTLAWGYNYLKNSGTAEELQILDEMSELIDQARETNDQSERSELYEEAMRYLLDLAVELPVYQRDVLYAINTNVIDASSLPSEINPFSSPLDRIWELKFAG